jgi:hypothetical protein
MRANLRHHFATQNIVIECASVTFNFMSLLFTPEDGIKIRLDLTNVYQRQPEDQNQTKIKIYPAP